MTKLAEWADDFEAAAHEVPKGIKSTVLMTRAQEVRRLETGLREVLDFLNSIEGAGYGGMASFEIARMHVREAVAFPNGHQGGAA